MDFQDCLDNGCAAKGSSAGQSSDATKVLALCADFHPRPLCEAKQADAVMQQVRACQAGQVWPAQQASQLRHGYLRYHHGPLKFR